MAASKRKSRTSKTARASWKGTLQFGLVSIPVEAFNAHVASEDHVSFHQLHAECHSRIHYEKVCPVHGAVPTDEIVSGYEYKKGKYVEVDPDEIDALKSGKERSLTVDAFVEPGQIDSLYFDGRMYFLSPAGDAAREPYTIFLEAMARKERWGIGQILWSGREQVAVIRPYAGALNMVMLNYADEMRDPDDVSAPAIRVSRADKRVRLAEQLIESWVEDDFDFSRYHDDYKAKVKKIIDAKVEGKEIVRPEVEDGPEVINLMDALRKSMARPVHGGGKGHRKRVTNHKKAPRRKTAKQGVAS
jgi:DNA end-binding protein Ku